MPKWETNPKVRLCGETHPELGTPGVEATPEQDASSSEGQKMELIKDFHDGFLNWIMQQGSW